VYTRTGETTVASIEALVINSSAPLGYRTNPVGSDPSVPMERQFYSTTRKCLGCNRFGHTRTAPDGSQIYKWDPLEGNEQGRAAGRGGPARTKLAVVVRKVGRRRNILAWIGRCEGRREKGWR
jgi:hypothetical protein